MKRRRFLQTAGAAIPAPLVTACAGSDTLDHDGLGAVAHTILPTELGAEAHERIAEAFREWVRGIRAGAERNHGYGTGTLAFVTANPAPVWQRQLEAMDREAQSHYGAGLAFINDRQRMQLVREALAPYSFDRLPDPLAAEHVAVAILAFFYRSPEATDLAYRAAIRKLQCRPLDTVSRPPVSLEPGA